MTLPRSHKQPAMELGLEAGKSGFEAAASVSHQTMLKFKCKTTWHRP